MARPERNHVDYFPFYCDDGKKMFYLEETYGNDGFAVFLKLLRELARTDFHFLDLSKNTTQMFLSAKCKVIKETLIAIITDLVELEKFDRMLWEENSIIWCQDFIDSIQDAYSKRKNKCITYEGLLSHLISLGIRKQVKSKPKGVIKPQSKEEYNKEEEQYPKKIFSNEIKNFTASLSKLFPENITTKLTDSQKRNWIDTVDKLIRIDKFTKQQIEKAIKAGRKDEFWSKQFLSLNKLRKLNKDDIKYINVFLNLNGHQQERKPPELKQITLRDDDRN